MAGCEPRDQTAIRAFARQLRDRVDEGSAALHADGQAVLDALDAAFKNAGQERPAAVPPERLPFRTSRPAPYRGLATMFDTDSTSKPGWFGVLATPIPYGDFKKHLEEIPYGDR